MAPLDLPHDLRIDLRVPLSVDARGGEPEIGVAGGMGDVDVDVEYLCPKCPSKPCPGKGVLGMD